MLAHFGAAGGGHGAWTGFELVGCFIGLDGLGFLDFFLFFLNDNGTFTLLLHLHQFLALLLFNLCLCLLLCVFLSLLFLRFLTSMPPLHVNLQLLRTQEPPPAIAERTLFLHLQSIRDGFFVFGLT